MKSRRKRMQRKMRRRINGGKHFNTQRQVWGHKYMDSGSEMLVNLTPGLSVSEVIVRRTYQNTLGGPTPPVCP